MMKRRKKGISKFSECVFFRGKCRFTTNVQNQFTPSLNFGTDFAVILGIKRYRRKATLILGGNTYENY